MKTLHLSIIAITIIAIIGTIMFVMILDVRHTSPAITNCYKKENVPDMECFVDSYQNCIPAKIQQIEYTVEGDPITVTAIIEKSDTSKECKIHAYYDSKDRFGFQGQYDSLCSKIRSENQFSWIIDQCENKDYAFGFHNR